MDKYKKDMIKNSAVLIIIIIVVSAIIIYLDTQNHGFGGFMLVLFIGLPLLIFTFARMLAFDMSASRENNNNLDEFSDSNEDKLLKRPTASISILIVNILIYILQIFNGFDVGGVLEIIVFIFFILAIVVYSKNKGKKLLIEKINLFMPIILIIFELIILPSFKNI